MKFSIKEFFSKFDQICSLLWIWSYLLKKSLMENLIFCAVLKHYQQSCEYGCSFVAKLSWKKEFFFWKDICVFLQNIHYFQKKMFLYRKKVLYLEMFLLKRNFFYREKYIWKCKKYISHLRNIFLYRKCLYYK